MNDLTQAEADAAAVLSKAKADESAALAVVNKDASWFKAHSLKIAIGAVALIAIVIFGLVAKHV